MDTKIYTHVEPKRVNVDIGEVIGDELRIKKYLSYVYQEYGDFYELNNLGAHANENSVDSSADNPNPSLDPNQITLLEHVNNFFAIEQSREQFTYSCFCVYFLYVAATTALSGAIGYIAAFLIFDTKLKILLAIVIAVLMQTVFLAGIPLVKKIRENSTCSSTSSVYEV